MWFREGVPAHFRRTSSTPVRRRNSEGHTHKQTSSHCEVDPQEGEGFRHGSAHQGNHHGRARVSVYGGSPRPLHRRLVTSLQPLQVKNLKRPGFKAGLGFDDKEIQGFIGQELLRNLRGQNPIFGRDVMCTEICSKSQARLCFPESTRTITESGSEYADRSLEELQYFVAHGEWPKKKLDQNDKSEKPN